MQLNSRVLVTVLLSISIASCWYAYNSTSEQRKDVFPEKIEVSNLVMTEGDWVQGCGIIIFEISNTTVSTINQENLAFFGQATVARNKQNHYRWQKTPIEESDNTDNSFVKKQMPGFSCAKSKIAHEYELLVSKNMKISGSYYAKSADRHLVVIPSHKLVIFEYSDQ